MLEIVALYFLTKHIGKLALQKGLKPGQWKFYTVAAWVLSELIGVIIGFLIFGLDNYFSPFMIGIAAAITSYHLLQKHLSALPDYNFNDDNSNS